MATKTMGKLKAEVTFNRDLTNLVDVMKSIAASQYHIMERKRTVLEKYKKALEELFSVYDFRGIRHPFVRAQSRKKLVCAITTDFGFLGGLNMKVIQAAMKHAADDTHYLVIGERGANLLKEYGRSHTQFPGINPDESRYELALKIKREVLKLVIKEGYGEALIVFPQALSLGSQRIQEINLVPCPMFYKKREGVAPIAADQDRQVILESPKRALIEALTSYWMGGRLIEIFESAKLSEYGARMMHLEDSFQTLSKIDKQLKLEYFKARREKIDQSLRETATAVLILKDL